MKTFKLLAGVGISLLLLASCAERTGNGESSKIPRVRITCSTQACRQAPSAPNWIATVFITRSGCDAPDFGAVGSGSTNKLLCNSLGCTGEISSWIDEKDEYLDEIENGIYSICGRIDDKPVIIGPFPTSGYIRGDLEDVRIGSGVSTFEITDWMDL